MRREVSTEEVNKGKARRGKVGVKEEARWTKEKQEKGRVRVRKERAASIEGG